MKYIRDAKIRTTTETSKLFRSLVLKLSCVYVLVREEGENLNKNFTTLLAATIVVLFKKQLSIVER